MLSSDQHISRNTDLFACLDQSVPSTMAAGSVRRVQGLGEQLNADSGLVMVDLAFWDDFFKQDRSWDDFGTTISGI